MTERQPEGTASFRAGFRAAGGDQSLEEAFTAAFSAGFKLGEKYGSEGESVGFWEPPAQQAASSGGARRSASPTASLITESSYTFAVGSDVNFPEPAPYPEVQDRYRVEAPTLRVTQGSAQAAPRRTTTPIRTERSQPAAEPPPRVDFVEERLLSVAEARNLRVLQPRTGNERYYTVLASRTDTFPPLGVYLAEYKDVKFPDYRKGGYSRTSDGLAEAVAWWEKESPGTPAPLRAHGRISAGVLLVSGAQQ